MVKLPWDVIAGVKNFRSVKRVAFAQGLTVMTMHEWCKMMGGEVKAGDKSGTLLECSIYLTSAYGENPPRVGKLYIRFDKQGTNKYKIAHLYFYDINSSFRVDMGIYDLKNELVDVNMYRAASKLDLQREPDDKTVIKTISNVGGAFTLRTETIASVTKRKLLYHIEISVWPPVGRRGKSKAGGVDKATCNTDLVFTGTL